jgi:hypothetical protein
LKVQSIKSAFDILACHRVNLLHFGTFHAPFASLSGIFSGGHGSAVKKNFHPAWAIARFDSDLGEKQNDTKVATSTVTLLFEE